MVQIHKFLKNLSPFKEYLIGTTQPFLKLNANQVEVRNSSHLEPNTTSHAHQPKQTFEPLLDYVGSWNLVTKLLSAQLIGKLASHQVATWKMFFSMKSSLSSLNNVVQKYKD